MFSIEMSYIHLISEQSFIRLYRVGGDVKWLEKPIIHTKQKER